jgi:hypothetical protein
MDSIPIRPVSGTFQCYACQKSASFRMNLPGLTSFFHNPWIDLCGGCANNLSIDVVKRFLESTDDWVLHVDMGTEPEYITTIKSLLPNLSISMIR